MSYSIESLLHRTHPNAKRLSDAEASKALGFDNYQQLKLKGINVEVVAGSSYLPGGPLGFWTPRNGGTFAVTLEDWQWLAIADRYALVVLALQVHHMYHDDQIDIIDNNVIDPHTGINHSETYVTARTLMANHRVDKALKTMRQIPWLTGCIILESGDFLSNTFYRHFLANKSINIKGMLNDTNPSGNGRAKRRTPSHSRRAA